MQSLDGLSIPAIMVLFAVISLVGYELGFRAGRWWQDREPGEQEGPTGIIVGGLLGLMAFVLAVTMGMATDRFDTRRALVLEDANAIRAAYLQADYLPPADAARLQALLREYAPLRIASDDRVVVEDHVVRSQELQGQMWAIETGAARSGYSGDLVASLGDSLTELATVAETRATAALHARVPETVLWILLFGSALSLVMLGYAAGLTRRRSLLSAAVLIVALGAVTTLVIDLDRPQDGFLRVSQQPLVDVVEWMAGPDASG
ncbi:MAG: hypothetical protein U0667_10735 [Chloroflexota bacterium]